MTMDYDVAIIGAGPAGTSYALAIRNAGLNVALIDKCRFPRNKTCGDAIPGIALKYLKKIRKETYDEFIKFQHKQKVTSSLVFLPGKKPLEFNWKLEAYNCKRYWFDYFLLEQVKKHTDTSIFEGVSIKNISRQGEKILLSTTNPDFSISCTMVIGCDGAHSIVSKFLSGNRQLKLFNSIALSAYYKNVVCKAQTNEVYLIKGFPGYFWIFPVGENIFNVGLGVYRTKSSKFVSLKKLLTNITTEHPEISPKFRQALADSVPSGFPLPIAGKGKEISGERFLLAGDAARLTDPLSGHGIDNAIKSGMLAAQHTEHCFKQKDFSSSFNLAYQTAVDNTIHKELNRNLKLMKLQIQFPRLLYFLYFFIKTNKAFFQKFI